MKLITLSFILTVTSYAYSQEATRYSENGQTHLIGPFDLAVLENDTLFSQWYHESYKSADFDLKNTSWKKNLKDTEVDIFLGTWCGDSKNWVPKFVRLWDELGLKRDQLNFVALYGSGDQYKQGPKHEEKGLNIHRVPTFIFKKSGNEYARIVESPQTDLVTDLAQIALGYPSAPNYAAANFLLDHFQQYSVDEMREKIKFYFQNAYHLVSKSNELNTLGYVLLKAGEIDKAIFTFELNSYLFRHEPNVYDSYGEALALAGKVEEAKKLYQKVLELDPENENAKEQLVALEGK